MYVCVMAQPKLLALLRSQGYLSLLVGLVVQVGLLSSVQLAQDLRRSELTMHYP